jgi:hypothetical protein
MYAASRRVAPAVFRLNLSRCTGSYDCGGWRPRNEQAMSTEQCSGSGVVQPMQSGATSAKTVVRQLPTSITATTRVKEQAKPTLQTMPTTTSIIKNKG